MKKTALASSNLFWIISTIGFMAIFATMLWLAYRGHLPHNLTPNDKIAHLVMYGMAAFLGHRALNRRHICKFGYSLPLFPFLFSLFTLGEELAQGFSPHRNLDLIDLIASFVGIVIGYWLAQKNWFSRKK